MNKKFLIAVLLGFTMTSGFAQISGTVKDQNGNPLAFALVCDENNVSNFDKTDENGAYRLSRGNSNTQLRVGALHMETIKSTSARDIVMSPDPLLETDEFHISFDHLRPGDSYTKEEVKDDFASNHGIGFYDPGKPNSDRASVDYNESIDPNGVSLKVKYPKEMLKPNNSGIDFRVPLENTFKDNYYAETDLYLSYWLKFDDDFDFNLCGGKLPSLGGSNQNTSTERDQNRWKGRIMFRKGGGIQFYMELPGDQENDEPDDSQNNLRFWGDKVVPGNAICEFEYENYLREKGWHNIELHYKFETSEAANDGLFEGWVDGENYDFVKSDYFNYYRSAGRENIVINHILISTFLGGSSAEYEPKKDYNIWFDEFRVSKTRINEWDTYTGTLTVDENHTQHLNSVYPNPSTGIYTLSERANWEVYDLLGKTIKTGSGNKIDIQGNPRGMYFLKTDTSDIVSKLMLN